MLILTGFLLVLEVEGQNAQFSSHFTIDLHVTFADSKYSVVVNRVITITAYNAMIAYETRRPIVLTIINTFG